jgi:hypothetical protein
LVREGDNDAAALQGEQLPRFLVEEWVRRIGFIRPKEQAQAQHHQAGAP